MTDSSSSSSPFLSSNPEQDQPLASKPELTDAELWATLEAKRAELDAHTAYMDSRQYGGPDGVPEWDADRHHADELRMELSWMRQAYYATDGGKLRLQQQTNKTRSSTAMLVSLLRAKWAARPLPHTSIQQPPSLDGFLDGLDPWAKYISAGTEQRFEKVLASFPPGSEAVFGMRTHLADRLINGIVVPTDLTPHQATGWRRSGAKPCEQVVMLGSGLDTSAGKHLSRRFFEVDLPEMIALKRQVISDLPDEAVQLLPYSEHNISYIPYTFGQQEQAPLLDLLVAQGFDPNKPTLWLMMGVSYYLTREQFCQTLSMISLFPGAHVFAFDYALPSQADSAQEELARLGEPIRFQCADIAPLLIEHHFPYIHEESFCAYYRRTCGLDAQVWPDDKRALRFVVCANNRHLMRARPASTLSFGKSCIG